MKQIVDGIEVELTPEEEDQYNLRQTDWEAGASQRMIDNCTRALEMAINDKAAEKSYSSGVSCASYKDSTNSQWTAEANTFIAWRDLVYTYAYDYLAKAQSGDIQNPNIENFMAGIPEMNWPNAI
ncbi:hypothetical protein [Legionella maceachernii]|uniref:Uncharacterized protein n=1 Tax=Legionella maceachernii TaxID=466 RepID=A0A0W0WBQ6_9GAMM|nr:hypothetical protein [Legionella maceachernii]KTD29662.1 hypothetical protein Lmac_0837 [Legionella maceachernii]SKA20927.1 hypothetical protein SAMN02745128_02580 [Legionella maceachernii]SUP02624.1 Uncharacterised protein [Legionella maceachernii]